MYQFVQKFLKTNSLVSVSVLSFVGLIGSLNSALAQQNIPVCQPPNSGEYLLLVISPTTNNQTQLRKALPPELKTTTCRYLKDTVTRIGGLTKIDDANRWARYVNNIVGLSAIITTKPSDTKPSDVVTTNQQQTVSYKPQQLGEGYAVLVDYFNRPEISTEVRQVVGGDVGFASYGRRPYLLAVYTTNQKDAYSTLQTLSERGFFAILVDSRKVMLLRSVVKL
ncbi:hypothetical protein [Iningainema tapete]|uniref:SPOR domain-containing protein n=1 Tax=Iningainema tapete BLCC-T55 TaxID=2748662 RepID=A0A8J6XJS3_9CYAN|nr:hypothetical protein [Iningainema tapete]MBD2778205.1 hypothetical protein [Iningainema tapete BLCC-T55]